MVHIYRTFALGILLTFLVVTCGCAKQHYLVVKEDSIALYYKNKDAEEVLFASSIDRFTPHPATRAGHDLWRVIVPKSDNFSYFYLVDKVPGIPHCELTVVDDFGARNCFFTSRM